MVFVSVNRVINCLDCKQEEIFHARFRCKRCYNRFWISEDFRYVENQNRYSSLSEYDFLRDQLSISEIADKLGIKRESLRDMVRRRERRRELGIRT